MAYTVVNIDDLSSFCVITRHLGKTTVRKDISLIKKYIDYCKSKDVDLSKGYETYLYELSQSVQKITLNNYIKALKTLEAYLVDRHNFTPFLSKIKYFKRHRLTIEPLTRQEKDLIYTSLPRAVRACTEAKTRHMHTLYKNFTLLLDMCGLRFDDGASLTVANIQSNALVFMQQKTEKTIKIPLEEPLRSTLHELCKNKSESDLVFLTTSGTKIIRHKYSEWMKIVGKQVGIKDFENRCHPHNLRRSYATELSEQGVDIRYIQDLMGHSDIESTAGYIYPSETKLRDSIKRLPLAKRHANPVDAFRDVVDAIKSLQLDSDNRFTYSLKEENKKLLFELQLKDS